MIDNRLALLTQGPDLAGAGNNALNAFLGVQQNQRRNKLLDLNQQRTEFDQGLQRERMDAAQKEFEQAEGEKKLAVMAHMLQGLAGIEESQIGATIGQYKEMYRPIYGDEVSRFDNLPRDHESIEQALSGLKPYLTTSKDAATRDFEAKAKAAGLKPGTPEYERAAKIDLGMEARASTSKDERIASNPELTDQVANSKATIAGAEATAKEAGKLEAQKELRPEVEAAVAQAVEQAKDIAERTDKAQSNETALNVYDQAMSGLVGSLSGTQTGPGMGWISLTANQQIADGAVAAMAPVLKQLFRSAGEGNFTDRDQQMLLDMVPTRKDHPEAIRAKIENIDAIVRAKLGGTPAQEATESQNSFDESLLEFMSPEDRKLFQ